ncbi:DeoR family transcriptional regulator [Brenneria izadpanahii]|uniref:DeoR family transcriptional regulator n=1 Tax=Brenneria izadpanahii TaxID=2722756 RepID=A0ABX7UX15_9GAMM|nr:DeoR family transcriptional regulator [Brenneria izadpanahii]QTF09117.1 DeoR family transcriptional regulator [Brenneria izadpanahii]
MKQKRQRKILEIMSSHQSLATHELVAMLGVSIETIRRDIRDLHRQGKIIRQHGKIKYLADDQSDNGLSFFDRFRRHSRNKKEVVSQVLSQIKPNMCIALDASSTCWYLSKQLPNIPLTVITNSFRICCELEKKDNITIICTGGTLIRKYSSFFMSADAMASIKSRQIDVFIFSCDSIDRMGNIWDTNNGNAKFKKYVFGWAKSKILLVDKSKIGSRGELNLFNLNEVTSIFYS